MKHAFQLSSKSTELARMLMDMFAVARMNFDMRVEQGAEAPQPLRAAIDAVAQEGGLGTVPLFAYFALTSPRAERHAAAAAVAALMAPLSSDALMGMERFMRSNAFYTNPLYGGFGTLKPREVSQPATGPRFPAAVFGVLSFHFSGYVRDAALRRLREYEDGQELPYLLMRTNDWVGLVQSGAAAAVKERLVPEHAARLAGHIALIQKLFQWQRHDHQELRQIIFRLLSRPDCRDALHATMALSDAKSRALLYDLLDRAGEEDVAGMLGAALRDADPRIRLWAARQFAARLTETELESLVDVALRDKFAGVRVQAAYAVAKRLPHRIAELLTPLWMDPAAAVRDVARHYTGKLPGSDCRAFYLAHLENADVSRLPVAIHGLAEVGNKTDAALLAGFAADARPKVSAAAIQALAQLDGDNHVEIFHRALLDGAPAAAKHAARALSTRAAYVDSARLWSAFHTQAAGPRRLRILRVLLRLGKWVALRYALLAMFEHDAKMREVALTAIETWLRLFNHSQMEPSIETRNELRELAHQHRGALSPEHYRQLAYLIAN